MARINAVLLHAENIERGMYVAVRETARGGPCPGVEYYKVLNYEDNADTRTFELEYFTRLDYKHDVLLLVGVEEPETVPESGTACCANDEGECPSFVDGTMLYCRRYDKALKSRQHPCWECMSVSGYYGGEHA